MTDWASAWEVIRWLLPFLAAAVAWWVRDRRKDRAVADIAERTVPAEVKLKDIGADQAQLVYVTQAFEAERSSYRATIADRDAEIQRKDAELAHARQVIASLRAQVERLEGKVADVTRELNSVKDQLSELDDHHPKEHA